MLSYHLLSLLSLSSFMNIYLFYPPWFNVEFGTYVCTYACMCVRIYVPNSLISHYSISKIKSYLHFEQFVHVYCLSLILLSLISAIAISCCCYIEALTKHLAVEWGPNNIRIACVAPGPIGDTVGYSKLGEYTASVYYVLSVCDCEGDLLWSLNFALSMLHDEQPPPASVSLSLSLDDG